MKQILAGLLTVIVFSSVPAFAAKFTSTIKMKSAALEKLARVADAINANEEVFGDAGSVAKFTYSRKASERNLNTIKQLNHAWGGIFSGEEAGAEAGSLSPQQLVEGLLYAIEDQEGEYPEVFGKAKADLISALAAIKADSSLKIYNTAHGDEDGSWGIINILDEKNSEVLLIQIGFSGT